MSVGKVQLLRLPLAGVPRIGVTRVGEVANTAAPLPVSSVSAAKRLAEVKDPSDVALPTDVIAPVRLALVVTLPAVSPEAVPVIFVPTKAEGVPRAGVTSVGDVANTSDPDPVSSLTAARRFAEDGVPRKVATPDPRLVKPVPPFATATGDVSEKTDPVSVSPVPAVNVPAPLNCDQGKAVVPKVPPAFAVHTKPQSPFAVPCSIKVKAEVNASQVFASVVRVQAPDAQR